MGGQGLGLFPAIGVGLTVFELLIGSGVPRGTAAVALPMGLVLVIVLAVRVVALNRARQPGPF